MSSDTKVLSVKDRWAAMDEKTREHIKMWHKSLRLIKANAFAYKQAGANPVQMIEDIEFTLQMLWGFPSDANYHTHWREIKGCSCPTWDNMERIGYGRVIDSSCPWHGGTDESND